MLIDKLAAGSAPVVVSEEVKHLRRLGLEAEAVVLTQEAGDEYSYEDILQGVPIRNLSRNLPSLMKSLANLKFPGFHFFSLYHLTSPVAAIPFAKSQQYDVIIAHATYTCFTARELSRRRGIPYLAFIWDPMSYILPHAYVRSLMRHAFPVLLPIAKRLDQYVVEESLAILACSNFHTKTLKALAGKKIEVVYPGCYPLTNVPQNRGDYILAVDRWDSDYLPIFLLDVLERLESQSTLVIAGFWHPASVYSSFMQQVRKRGLRDRVKVLGPVNRQQLVELYSHARVLAHPEEEVFGFVAHEAAGHGCPFVMPRSSGNAELYSHGVHGYFTELYDPDNYAVYLDKLISDESAAWKMGFEAWKVASQYDWANHSSRLKEIIGRYV